MKKKNGFTLVEIIAVVALIGIIMLLVVPNIVRTLDKGKQGTFATLVQDIYKQAEKEYVEDYAYDEEKNSYCDSEAVDYFNDELNMSCKPLMFNDETASYYVELNNKGKVSTIVVFNDEYCYVSYNPTIDVKYYDVVEGYLNYSDENEFECLPYDN